MQNFPEGRVNDYWTELQVFIEKALHALRGYFGPPMRPENEIRFSPNSSL